MNDKSPNKITTANSRPARVFGRLERVWSPRYSPSLSFGGCG
jgi:hypothetical protein